MHRDWKEVRILIWGKTYPELSTKYYETVCTGGVTEEGDFVRLYPIPFRYLAEDVSFSKYQWIKARIKKSSEDPRPESFKVDPESIVLEEKVLPTKEWLNRKPIIFKSTKYIFNSAEELFIENKNKRTSMGFVKPKKILGIEIEERPPEDYIAFVKKFEENKERSKQTELFGFLTPTEIRKLQYISKRFKIHWCCENDNCKGHKMSILDWEAYELVRKAGINHAYEKLSQILFSKDIDLGFFLGNFRLHPTAFTIGGIWYPKKSNLAPNLKLF